VDPAEPVRLGAIVLLLVPLLAALEGAGVPPPLGDSDDAGEPLSLLDVGA